MTAIMLSFICQLQNSHASNGPEGLNLLADRQVLLTQDDIRGKDEVSEARIWLKIKSYPLDLKPINS
jgi:hypothetical protein